MTRKTTLYLQDILENYETGEKVRRGIDTRAICSRPENRLCGFAVSGEAVGLPARGSGESHQNTARHSAARQ